MHSAVVAAEYLVGASQLAPGVRIQLGVIGKVPGGLVTISQVCSA